MCASDFSKCLAPLDVGPTWEQRRSRVDTASNVFVACGMLKKFLYCNAHPRQNHNPQLYEGLPGRGMKGLQPPPFHNPVTRDPSSSVYQGHAVIMARETADFLLWGVKLLLPTQFPDIPRPRSCKFRSREVF